MLFVESPWFLARRDDAVVVSLLQGVETLPGAAMAREKCIGIFQTGPWSWIVPQRVRTTRNGAVTGWLDQPVTSSYG